MLFEVCGFSRRKSWKAADLHRTQDCATLLIPRDLRYRFTDIEARLRRGEEIEIRKHKQVIARLVPVRPKPGAYPDFAARQRKIFGDKIVSRTGAELVASDRDRY